MGEDRGNRCSQNSLRGNMFFLIIDKMVRRSVLQDGCRQSIDQVDGCAYDFIP